MTVTVPNTLTFFRIALVPVFAATFFISEDWAGSIAFALFVIASLTDFLDGYLARRLKQTTSLGAFLDPLADKLLVVTALFFLVAQDVLLGLAPIAAYLIIIREIFISGLREHLHRSGRDLPVINFAKFKTAAQMIALSLLLLDLALGTGTAFYLPGVFALWMAAVMSVYTAWIYSNQAWEFLPKRS